MNNSDNIYSLVCKLYDLYKKNPSLEVSCSIETAQANYYGSFVFDENFVISTDCLVLNNSLISKDIFSEASHYDKTIINFNAINAFSYKILEPKMSK